MSVTGGRSSGSSPRVHPTLRCPRALAIRTLGSSRSTKCAVSKGQQANNSKPAPLLTPNPTPTCTYMGERQRPPPGATTLNWARLMAGDGCWRTKGIGLQNRRLQVRFLSHLPSQSPNLSRLRPHGVQSVLRALTPLDPNESNTGSHVSDAQLVNDALAHQWTPQSLPSQ
jgi:hypothetical protein